MHKFKKKMALILESTLEYNITTFLYLNLILQK